MKYSVSVIIPIYNVAEYIERCAYSLFKQTLASIEFIFVDDKSPDDSISRVEKILEGFSNRKNDVKIIRHGTNKGLPSARNSGLKVARGEYIFHCDSDDWIQMDAIEEMYNFIKSRDADIIWTDFYYSLKDYELLAVQNLEGDKNVCIRAMMREGMHGAVWNKMYKRSLFSEYAIEFPDGVSMWEDLYTNIMLFYYGNKVAYFPKAFYHYNQCNSSSIGSGGYSDKKLKEIIINTDSIIDFLDRKQADVSENDINMLKLASKQTLLFTTDKSKFKEWTLLYPESNRNIMGYKSLPIHLRLLGWSSWKGLWFIVSLWTIIKKVKK
ncbi:glycosyltransferase family 2 protein [Elizabethkingia ursingii]|uniref:glycosyltransferase family 2 protein n=1 Tax=Elizabethkingia ursingii TaxID=1756150 RepID=UPI0020137B1A|nr:glycosyltransferase family 2 protein [Elizabethkingia ursingii]MCL1671536.1 glycosyltransferase family 2 protein [Elizabethkingia ursingii]